MVLNLVLGPLPLVPHILRLEILVWRVQEKFLSQILVHQGQELQHEVSHCAQALAAVHSDACPARVILLYLPLLALLLLPLLHRKSLVEYSNHFHRCFRCFFFSVLSGSSDIKKRLLSIFMHHLKRNNWLAIQYGLRKCFVGTGYTDIVG